MAAWRRSSPHPPRAGRILPLADTQTAVQWRTTARGQAPGLRLRACSPEVTAEQKPMEPTGPSPPSPSLPRARVPTEEVPFWGPPTCVQGCMHKQNLVYMNSHMTRVWHFTDPCQNRPGTSMWAPLGSLAGPHRHFRCLCVRVCEFSHSEAQTVAGCFEHLRDLSGRQAHGVGSGSARS